MVTPRQRARRERILETAALLAVDGGLEALQMRDVASHAEVAISTLYRYFPSKTHLVLALLERELQRLRDEFASAPPPGDDPVARVRHVLHRIVSGWHSSPPAVDAMVRAYLTAGQDAAAARGTVGDVLQEVLVLAMWGPEVDARPRDRAVARVLETLLVGSLAAWAGARASTDELLEDLDLAAGALLSSR